MTDERLLNKVGEEIVEVSQNYRTTSKAGKVTVEPLMSAEQRKAQAESNLAGMKRPGSNARVLSLATRADQDTQ